LKISFEKYQGTGNDFIMIDDRSNQLNLDQLPVPDLCDRRFGIGADGLIVIREHKNLDFEMIYFNSDGSQSFCGNGSRCAVAFAKSLGMITSSCEFLSTDGAHTARFDGDLVELDMHDVSHIETTSSDYIINTGSPHYLKFVDSVEDVDIIPTAHNVRYNDTYKAEGINVNFLEPTETGLNIRTYERGVENETLSCGTGVTAAAIALYLKSDQSQSSFNTTIHTLGGELEVSFETDGTTFHKIVLKGPAKKTFEGLILL